MPDFSTPNKKCIRKYYNKTIIKYLKDKFHCNITYYGLPSPDAEDIAEWIDYISKVVAFQCRDYGKVSNPDQPTDEVDKLIEKLNHWEASGQLDDYIVYDGYMEEVLFKGFDNSASGSIEYTHENHITLFNLDFCNSITSPQEYITKNGDRITKYKLELIDKILEYQSTVSNQSDKFILFLTVQASYAGADLAAYLEANKIYLSKYESHKQNKCLKLKHFIEDNLYQKIKTYNYVPQFMPTVFYKGIHDVDMMHFVVMCIRPQENKKQGGVFVYNQLVVNITDSLPLLPDPANNALKNFPEEIDGMNHPNVNFIHTFSQSKNVSMYWND
ncbi:hypothetical protein [Parabacteroides sp.]